MHKITKDLNAKGFSVNSVNYIITRNNGTLRFNTSEFFFILIVFEKTNIIVEGRTYSVEAGNLVFIGPHKNFDFEQNDTKNFVISFSSSFYEKSAKDSFILHSHLFFNDLQDVFIAKALANEEGLKRLILDRIHLYKNKEIGIYIAVAHNCIEILLLDGLLSLEENAFEKSSSHSTYFEKVNRFRVLLQKYFKQEKSVSFYSEKLHISPQRLSVMTKSVLGKGAKRVVVEKITKEAVRMLENTTLNISEIALELGFADEANFSTFIKKNLGKTPSEMRDVLLKSEKNTN